MTDVLEKPKLKKSSQKRKMWKVMVLTNKGAFFSPQTFPSKEKCDHYIIHLKAYHAQNARKYCGNLHQWNGQYVVPKAYISMPMDD